MGGQQVAQVPGAARLRVELGSQWITGGAPELHKSLPLLTPGASFPPHTPPFLTPSYLLAKKATQGKRRSWVSTKTFWTNRLGLQLCCRFKDRVSQNHGNRIRLGGGRGLEEKLCRRIVPVRAEEF